MENIHRNKDKEATTSMREKIVSEHPDSQSLICVSHLSVSLSLCLIVPPPALPSILSLSLLSHFSRCLDEYDC